ncbi:MAG: hypothetical protein DMF40_12030 [Verrucomicrobia bacterium]|nr:MAG: hypothetical protein DME38_00280 [Verrucomicrobiota bacterium]PYL46508.1 MAG: hypothetical protein DMF40_12030 [Verrucomicrobiota bacterium]
MFSFGLTGLALFLNAKECDSPTRIPLGTYFFQHHAGRFGGDPVRAGLALKRVLPSNPDCE